MDSHLDHSICVAGVASNTGIVGFTGQAITGFLKLKALVHGAATAREIIGNVLEGIDLPRDLERAVEVLEADLKLQVNRATIPRLMPPIYHTVSCTKDVEKRALAPQKVCSLSQR